MAKIIATELFPTQDKTKTVQKTKQLLSALYYPVLGIMALLACWYIGVWFAVKNGLFLLADFAPIPTYDALIRMAQQGILYHAITDSLGRILLGIGYAIAIGLPLGIALGLNHTAHRITVLPIQFLRMTSPLSLMPIVVMVMDTWENAIVFLLAFSAIWPILLSTSNGVNRIDKGWLKVAENYQVTVYKKIRYVILPAIASDIFAGIRLSIGVCWVVLVPAEFLGVTSGLGYAINDARDTLDYSAMTALVLIIGTTGYALDTLLRYLTHHFSWSR